MSDLNFDCDSISSCDECYYNTDEYEYDPRLSKCIIRDDYMEVEFDVDEILNEIDLEQQREDAELSNEDTIDISGLIDWDVES